MQFIIRTSVILRIINYINYRFLVINYITDTKYGSGDKNEGLPSSKADQRKRNLHFVALHLYVS